jgi:hypothetical protein
MKRQATAAEKKYMGMVSALSCACCGVPGPSQVHHIREGQGIAQRAANWLTIPLCQLCHQSDVGIHGDKSMMLIHKTTELDMLADTIHKVSGL